MKLRLQVPRASAVFDAGGNLADPRIEEQLQAFLQGFADRVRRENGAA
ncbi:MAG: hypothetical protein WC048_12100 [Rhizobium sp.]